MDKLAVVIVTYKRQALLEGLLTSLLMSTEAPWRVFIVDNENSQATKDMVSIYSQIVSEGITATLWPEGASTFVYVPMSENTGGAGGFAEGVRQAYRSGAEWFWLMDDDVEVISRGLESLERWTDDFDVIQGSRLDFDGGAFYWQYRFIVPFGIYNPFASSRPTKGGYRKTNTACFEGCLFNRKIVSEIGPPDARFFIYWDDCVYGYLASKHGNSAVVDDLVLKRTRNIENLGIGNVRQLNRSSDMTRYHVMRNRGHMAHYLRLEGDYNPVAFGIGTLSCVAKELIRIVALDRESLSSGLSALWRGWREARRIMDRKNWKPVTKDDL